MRRLVVIAAFLAALTIGPRTFAATYYVDYEAGSDASRGISKAEAWRHSPGDDNATGNPRQVRLEPGDKSSFAAECAIAARSG